MKKIICNYCGREEWICSDCLEEANYISKITNDCLLCVDYDGNIYRAIKIGNQIWTVENFRGIHYNDGTPIPNVTWGPKWQSLTNGARCYYNNDSVKYADKYGALYNWHAVNTGKLAPAGWHVPTDAEWIELENYLIANGYNWDGSTGGNKIGKSLAATTDWNSSSDKGEVGNDMESNNYTGFTALPGGYRVSNGDYYFLGLNGCWWSSTESLASGAYSRHLGCNYPDLLRYGSNKAYGFSVRFVRDVE